MSTDIDTDTEKEILIPSDLTRRGIELAESVCRTRPGFDANAYMCNMPNLIDLKNFEFYIPLTKTEKAKAKTSTSISTTTKSKDISKNSRINVLTLSNEMAAFVFGHLKNFLSGKQITVETYNNKNELIKNYYPCESIEIMSAILSELYKKRRTYIHVKKNGIS